MALLTSLLVPAAASARILTVGSPIEGNFATAKINVAATFLNLAVTGPDAELTSPVDGAIVNFRVLGGEGGPYVIRALRPRGGSYKAVASGNPVYFGEEVTTPKFKPVPIREGDAIGLDIPVNAKIGISAAQPGSAWAAFVPSLTDGSTAALTKSHAGVELGFNAQILPRPTVTAVQRGFARSQRRSMVLIRGTDFTAGAEVSFGKLPAVSAKVEFEGAIVAVAPPRAKGATQVRVTTEAGISKATKASRIVLSNCRVPRLVGKTLARAVTRIRAASCRLGRVDGYPSRNAIVQKQSPAPGKNLPFGTRVNLGLR